MTTKGLTAGMVKESSRPGNDGTSGLTMMAWAGGGGGLTIGGGRGLVTARKKVKIFSHGRISHPEIMIVILMLI